MTPKRVKLLRRKLQEARYRLVTKFPRFASPLRTMLFVATKDVEHISTNGVCIYFDPDWLQKLQPEAIDFILSHQLMHIALGHIHRSAFYRGARYHLACDIVANSNLRKLGWEQEKLPGIGTIYHTTFFPVEEGSALTPEEAFSKIPFDPSSLSVSAKRRYLIDSEAYWERTDDRGQLGIIVLSPDDPDPDDLKLEDYLKSPSSHDAHTHIIPQQLPPIDDEEDNQKIRRATAGRSGSGGQNPNAEEELLSTMDSILDLAASGAKRAQAANSSIPEYRAPQTWDAKMKEKIKTVRFEKEYAEQKAQIRFADERIWQKSNHVCLDWRKLLDAFLQEEVCDYSFTPPDRRFQDGDFFLPDFNDTMIQPLKLLFMVDTSGSVNDELLSIVYTEILSAIEQFNGMLTGILGFFDTRVYTPVPFSSVNDIRRMRPYGGGGTDFSCIFRDCRNYFGDDHLSSIVIITDGHGDFPQEAAAASIPTLWLLTDQEAKVPWGRCAWLSRE